MPSSPVWIYTPPDGHRGPNDRLVLGMYTEVLASKTLIRLAIKIQVLQTNHAQARSEVLFVCDQTGIVDLLD